MASAITSLPGQQPPAAAGEIEQPNINIPSTSNSTSANWHSSSGSIGPFFGVISVLTVLAILSCILGRVCSRRAEAGAAAAGEAPSNTIKHRKYFGWLRRKSNWRRGAHVEAGAKVLALEREKHDSKAKDGEDDQQSPQP